MTLNMLRFISNTELVSSGLVPWPCQDAESFLRRVIQLHRTRDETGLDPDVGAAAVM